MRILIFTLLSLMSFVRTFAQISNLEMQVGNQKNIIPITQIDSITYENDGTSYYQIVWNKEQKYKSKVSDICQASFPTTGILYNNFEAKEYGVENGIINSLGQYAAIGIDTISNNGAVIVIGDVKEDTPQITIHIDSLKLVRYVYSEGIIYRYFYGQNDFTVLTLNEQGDSLNCKTYTYSQLQESRSKKYFTKKIGGTISNSGWFNLFSLIDMSTSMSRESLLTNWASMQHNPWLSLGGDIWGFAKGNWYSKALILLKWLDGIWNSYVFRGASIVTLPHKELSIDAVNLSCSIMGLKKIPRIKNFEAYAICSMNLRAKSGISGAPTNQYMNWQTQTRNINSDGIQNFDFSNLLLESQYEYYPKLNLAWTEAEASIWVKLSDDIVPDIEDWTITTEEHKSFQTLKGDEGVFFTSKPSAVTEDAHYVTVTSAVVGCVFTNTPNSASCGVEYTDGKQIRTIVSENQDGENFIAINKITRNTTYTYKAFVRTPYKTYYGKEMTFTTKEPSCSTGDVLSSTDKSVLLKCYYYDVEDDECECGVTISHDNDTKIILTSRTEGGHNIEISGLLPSTTYNYWAFVNVDGEPINGEVKSFTTNPPDISGTWTCKETHYKFNNVNYPYYTTYTVTLNEDGSVSCSDTSGIVSSSWTFKSNGEVEFEFMDLATQMANSGKKWKGNIDDMNNPRKITGYTNRWNYNQNGFFNGDAVEFEMTR